MKQRICALLMVGVPLLFSGCGAALPEGHAGQVVIAASFLLEDGAVLRGGAVRFSDGESGADYPLDENGEVRASGLPRAGELSLTVLDQREQARGGMMLSLSEGAVIDATTDESGVGYITLRADTEEVALLFVLNNDGSLFCSLRLIESDARGVDLLQEATERER